MPKNAVKNDQHSTQTQDDNIMGRQRLKLLKLKMNKILYIAKPNSVQLKLVYMVMMRRRKNTHFKIIYEKENK